jgi:DNA-binding LacI/PurR family transcriptional regulator
LLRGVLYRIPTKGTFVSDKKSAKKTTHSIGYFLDSGIEQGLSSPYYSLIFNALEKEASKHGYLLTYFTNSSDKILEKTVAKLDGAIVSSFPRIENIIQNIKQHVPVVALDNASSDKTIPSVIIDNFNAVLESFDHLYKLGHRRIAFMTGLDHSDIDKNRCTGYQNGLSRHGLKFDESLVFRGSNSFPAGIEGAAYFLNFEQPPTAIICANDSMALGAIRKLRQEGVGVPEDISILGFDDIDVASQITPSLTTVKAPIKEIAQYSFDMLKKLILDKELENKHIALPAKLVIRQTCGKVVENTAVA